VESIWIQEADSHDVAGVRPTVVLPSGAPEVLLYYGDPFVRLVGEARHEEPRLAFSGQRTRAIRVAATGRTGIVIVRFHPWGAAWLFGEPMDAFRDRTLTFDEVARRDSAILLQRLLGEACEVSDRVRLLEDFLAPRLTARRPDPLGRLAVAAIRRSRGTEPIHRLAESLGVSRRHLARVFRGAVGMSPKRFAALMRFQASLRHRATARDWTEVAAACGFHDQAHLIRSWRQFAGEPPKRLVDRSGDTALGAFFNDPAKSHSYNSTYL